MIELWCREEYVRREGDAWVCGVFDLLELNGAKGNIRMEGAVDAPWIERDDGAWTFMPCHLGEHRIEWDGRNALLRVEPSSTSKQMLDEVGALAVDLASWATWDHRVWEGDEKGADVGARTKVDPAWLERLIDEIERNFTLVERSPCRDLVRGTGLLRVERSTAPHDLLRRKTQPEGRTVHGTTRVETFDAPENRWLKRLLTQSLPELVKAERRKGSDSLLYDPSAQTTARDEATKRREKHEAQLSDLKKRLETMKNATFLRDVKVSQVEVRPTKRLIARAGYAGIYRAFHGPQMRSIETLAKLHAIREQIERGGIRKLSNLYELWCLFRLYADLREHVGLSPVGQGPQDALSLVGGRLEVAPGRYELYRPFALEDPKVDRSKKNLKVTLHYQRKCTAKSGGDRFPDLWLEIDAPERALGGGELNVVLDAKLRDYGRLGGRTAPEDRRYSLRHDIEEVALKKYARDLQEGADASFILHSSKGSDWRGERPYADFLGQPRSTFEDEWLRHPGHQIGALLYKPGDAAGRARLLTIVFHHLLGLTSLCLNCGRELTENRHFIDNATRKPKKRGVYEWEDEDPQSGFHATCDNPDCKQEWNVSFCNGRDDLSGLEVSGVLHGGKPCFERTYAKRGRPRENNRLVQPVGQKAQHWSGIHGYEGGKLICPLCGAAGPQGD